MNNKPVGIFDSGIGGTSVWKEVNRLLPAESTVYLADSKNAPYGEKSRAEIQALSMKNTELLLERGCKLIIVACNTATTNAIDLLRDTYAVPFVGIEPAIKPAAIHTETGAVGVLATRGTLSSELFSRTSDLFAGHIKVVEQIGDGLVALIEEGNIDSETMRTLLHKYLDPMIENNIDHLVLGCTHYPYLIHQIRAILPKKVKIIDSGEAVARQTKKLLENNNLLSGNTPAQSEFCFYTNRDANVLKQFVSPGEGKRIKVSYLDF